MKEIITSARLPVLFSVIVGLALRIFFLLNTPIASVSIPGQLSSYNDEIAHGNYILHVLREYSLPTAIDPITADSALYRGQFENHQSPLYYIVVASICKLTDIDDIKRIIVCGRLLNIFIFILVLLVYWHVTHYVFKDKRATYSGIIFLSLSGVFVRFTSTASNDPLFWCFIGLLILYSLKLLDNGLKTSTAVPFCIFSVLGVYAKLSTLLIFPLLLIVSVKRKVLDKWYFYLTTLAVIFILTIPLWLHNLYAFSLFIPLESGFGQAHWHFPDFSFLLYFLRSFIFPWSEFWSGFYGLILMLIPTFYILYNVYKEKSWNFILSNTILKYSLILSVSAFLMLDFKYDQAEGRYLFAAWPSILLLISFPKFNNLRLWIFALCLLLPYILLSPAFKTL